MWYKDRIEGLSGVVDTPIASSQAHSAEFSSRAGNEYHIS
jgi:hypothetical protein